MPKKYGVKEKDQVVAYVVNLVLTGKLRTGDRIDRNEVAHDLGVSRVPIQEAVVQLEHDGIIATRYHRGAFVERFDDATILEHHEIYGLLNGLASARAAADADPAITTRLDALLQVLRSNTESRSFHEAGGEYRQTITDQYAGPRLSALIRASQTFVPRGFWATYPHIHNNLLPFYEHETDAIRRHDPAAARAANVERSALMARIMLAELSRRGVLGDLRSE